MPPFEPTSGSNNRAPLDHNISQPQLPRTTTPPSSQPQQLHPSSSPQVNLPRSQSLTVHASAPRALALRQQTTHPPRHSSPHQDSLSRSQPHPPTDTSQFTTTPPNRSPSPSITAAAMSLGALAAAASLAAAAVPSNQSHSGSYALTHMPQHNVSPYPHQAPKQEQTAVAIPSSSKAEPVAISKTATQSLPTYATNQRRPEPSAPSSLKPMAPPPLPHAKVNPKPVAPAPTNAMHPSQQQLSNTRANGKPKQRRYRATPEQLRQLIALFEINPSPSSAELQELAAKITMPTQSVVLWFKNRRARVPHKKAEKALNAKRRENGELPISGGASRSSKQSQHSKKPPSSTKKENTTTAVTKSPSSSEKAVAASMAEMAMAIASGDPPNPPEHRQPAQKMVKQETAQPAPRAEPFPCRSPSRSPPPTFRSKVGSATPFDSNLVQRLGAHASQGAEFVAASQSTPRRPRTIPPTPRLKPQNEYSIGDAVEVLENGKGICRSWYSATVIGTCGPLELSLGASAAAAGGLGTGMSGSAVGDRVDIKSEDNGDGGDGGDSPRTVRSPAASPTPPAVKFSYVVEYEHRFEDAEENRKLREEVVASRLRPAAPFSLGEGYEEWRPEILEPVEVLRHGAWFVGVVHTFAVRKGYMVSFEDGDVAWVRRPRLRPHQIWKGGRNWVTKMKPPLPVVRKSVGLRVTHPPGGKKKRANGETGKERETRGRNKRCKTTSMDGSGPDGLPEGWRVVHMRGAGIQKQMAVYVAPDGHRLKSLKEAQRYVQMMGPV
eukprot:GFKZ01008588.1.p1 GENE.GFKZ01008588.1~~GFKZ01008588.1.p1  ORF type:complete len:777 (-),score=99.73 GFKZ01008588.1:125-2455(-)